MDGKEDQVRQLGLADSGDEEPVNSGAHAEETSTATEMDSPRSAKKNGQRREEVEQGRNEKPNEGWVNVPRSGEDKKDEWEQAKREEPHYAANQQTACEEVGYG